MTSVPLLQSVMPPILWTHINEKVDTMVVEILNMEKTIPTQPTPFNVLLLKMFYLHKAKDKQLLTLLKEG
jgi:hypothetical protein